MPVRFHNRYVCPTLTPLEDRVAPATIDTIFSAAWNYYDKEYFRMSKDGSTLVMAQGGQFWVWTDGVQSGPMLGLQDYRGEAPSVSGNGDVIYGTELVTSAAPRKTFRWTESSGKIEIGDFYVYGTDVDGSVAVGQSGYPAVIWSETAGVEIIGPNDGRISTAFGVSDNGSTVVGAISYPSYSQGFVWTHENGLVEIPILSGYESNGMLQLSGDGQRVFGIAMNWNTNDAGQWFTESQTFLWTRETGTRGLGVLPGAVQPGTGSYPSIILSKDGSTLVTNTNANFFISNAYRWDSENGFLGVGHLLGESTYSEVTAINSDGTILVGVSRRRSTNMGTTNPFLWDKQHGIRDLRTALVSDYQLQGLLDGWQLLTVDHMSEDGLVLAGTGYHGSSQRVVWRLDLRNTERLLDDFREASTEESGHERPDTLVLQYTLEMPTDSISLAFYTSRDVSNPFNLHKSSRVDQLILTPKSMQESNGLIRVLQGDNAFTVGSHKLLITPRSDLLGKLSKALTNKSVEYLVGVVGDLDNPFAQVPFSGTYFSPISDDVVVRGTYSDDEVSIINGVVTFIPGAGPNAGNHRFATIRSDQPVLFMTADGDDVITPGVGKDTLVGGKGSDRYAFTANSSGHKTIIELNAAKILLDFDRLDFTAFAAPIMLDLRKRSIQSNSTLGIRFVNTNSIEGVLGTEFDDKITGTARPNILVGGGGNDTVTSTSNSKSMSLLLGDGYTWDSAALKRIYGEIYQHKFSLGEFRVPIGSGDDTLLGGAYLDVIFGGDGSDLIAGGNGGNFMFGDNLQINATSTHILDMKELVKKNQAKLTWAALTKTVSRTDFGLSGTGNDVVTGGNGVDIIFGGVGHDVLDTKRGSNDFAFGGVGNDTISSTSAGIAVLIGEEGDDTISVSSADTKATLLFGDSFDFSGTALPLDFDFNPRSGAFALTLDPLTNVGSGNDQLSSKARFGLVLGGLGNDKLQNGNGLNLLIGDGFDSSFNPTASVSSIDFVALLQGHYPVGLGLISTSGGADTLLGGDKADLLVGGPGEDSLRGAGGNDNLYGGDGVDILYGDEGNDGLNGGADKDNVSGGVGSDRFLYMAGTSGDKTDADSDDASMLFEDAGVIWDEREIEAVDAGLRLLHQRTGNNSLLETSTGGTITFYRQVAMTDSNGYPVFADNNNAGAVNVYQDAFGLPLSPKDFVTASTIIHEMGHNWDTEHNFTPSYTWSKWLKESGWRNVTPPTSQIGKYTDVIDHLGVRWWYLNNATFGADYGSASPYEDFATAWESYFVTKYGLVADATMGIHTLSSAKYKYIDKLFNKLS